MSGLRLLMLWMLQTVPSRAIIVTRGAWVARRSVRLHSQLKASAARGWSLGNDGRWVSNEQAARAETSPPPPLAAALPSIPSADASSRRAPSPVAHLFGSAPVTTSRMSAVASAVAAPARWVAAPEPAELEQPPGVLVDEGEIAVHEVDTVEEVTPPLAHGVVFSLSCFIPQCMTPRKRSTSHRRLP
jgi:hypothetical protein